VNVQKPTVSIVNVQKPTVSLALQLCAVLLLLPGLITLYSQQVQNTNDKWQRKRRTGTECEIKLLKWSQTSKYNWSKVTMNGGCKRTV